MYDRRPPMPHGSRLRPLQPLRDRHGFCPLVYDVERALLLGVPEDLGWHAAKTLETGDLDDALLGWLAGEDLLTWKGRPGAERPAVLPSAATPRGAGRGEQVRCHPSAPSVAAVGRALEALIRRTVEGSRIVLHLVAEGELERPDAVRRAVAAARRAALAAGRAVGFELTTDGRGVSAPFARFLAEHEVAVRLTADSPALDALLRHLPDRLTYSPVLDNGDRLLDCWRRSRALGLRRLAPVKLSERPLEGLAVFEAELRQYRQDLFEVSDDLWTDLSAGGLPQTVHEPLARVVHRHVAGRPQAPPSAARPAEGAPHAPDHLGTGGLADCAACWGADLCARNVLAGPGPHDVRPRADRCELWRAEIEVGLLLCHALEKVDPGLPAVLADPEEEAVDDEFSLAIAADLRTC